MIVGYRIRENRRLWATWALSMLTACASSPPPSRPAADCRTMTPSELLRPIEGDPLRIDDWLGNMPDFRMWVDAPLDADGYVRRPRMVTSRPPGIPNEQILETIATWRFCPELAKSLGGRPYRIPIVAERRGLMGGGEL